MFNNIIIRTKFLSPPNERLSPIFSQKEDHNSPSCFDHCLTSLLGLQYLQERHQTQPWFLFTTINSEWVRPKMGSWMDCQDILHSKRFFFELLTLPIGWDFYGLKIRFENQSSSKLSSISTKVAVYETISFPSKCVSKWWKPLLYLIN